MTGLHRNITLSFMMVGHTKFSSDWCFGLFKQRYRHTYVSSLEDIETVVNSSTEVNVTQLVGTQAGETVVCMYDCTLFFREHFRNVPHLKRFHHFSFSAESPRVVSLKEYSDSASTMFVMRFDEEWQPAADELLTAITPAGLPLAWQLYLYEQIREYCRNGREDLVCPNPHLANHVHSSDLASTEEDINGRAVAPHPKRVRRCGKCGIQGHTKRTCKELLDMYVFGQYRLKLYITIEYSNYNVCYTK